MAKSDVHVIGVFWHLFDLCLIFNVEDDDDDDDIGILQFCKYRRSQIHILSLVFFITN